MVKHRHRRTLTSAATIEIDHSDGYDGSYLELNQNASIDINNFNDNDLEYLFIKNMGDFTLEFGGVSLPMLVGNGKWTGFVIYNLGGTILFDSSPAISPIAPGSSFPTANRVGLWKLADIVTSGSIVTSWPENTGNGKDWTSISGSEPVAPTGGGGATFDGTKGMTQAIPITVNAPYTVYARIKPTALGHEILGMADGTNGYGLYFDTNTMGHSPRLGGVLQFSGTGYTLPLNVSEVVAFVWDGVIANGVNVYVNGTLALNLPNTFDNTPYRMVIDRIGGEGAPYKFDGEFFDLAIFSVAHNATAVGINSPLL